MGGNTINNDRTSAETGVKVSCDEKAGRGERKDDWRSRIWKIVGNNEQ